MPFKDFHFPLKIDTEPVFQNEEWVLLDKNDRILAARSAPHQLCVGTDFFSIHPIDARDREALINSRFDAVQAPLLLCPNGQPILAFCHFYASARMTLVLLPDGAFGQLLASSAAYFSRIENVIFAPSALLRSAPVTNEGYRLLSTGLAELCHLYAPRTAAQGTPLSVIHLENCAVRLAKHFGRSLTCQSQGYIGQGEENFDHELAIGHLIAALLLTLPLTENTAIVAGAERLNPNAPMFFLSFPCAITNLPKELTLLSRAAYEHGALFECALINGELRIGFSICHAEISSQGTKTDFCGTTDAPVSLPIHPQERPIDISKQASIPLFQKEIAALRADKE